MAPRPGAVERLLDQVHGRAASRGEVGARGGDRSRRGVGRRGRDFGCLPAAPAGAGAGGQLTGGERLRRLGEPGERPADLFEFLPKRAGPFLRGDQPLCHPGFPYFGPPSTRAGRRSTAPSSENTPSTAMPSSRKGSSSNQTIG